METKEKKRLYDIEYRKRNKSRIRAYQKVYVVKNREAVNSYQRDYCKKNPDKVRNRSYKHSYGITLEAYNQILTKQNGVCAICKSQDQFKARLSVDHVHHTKIVRGLLCHKCNVALGLLSEDTCRIKRALEYVQGGVSC